LRLKVNSRLVKAAKFYT